MVVMQQPAAAVVLVCVAEGHVGQHNHWWRGRRHLHLKHSLQSKRQLWSVIGWLHKLSSHTGLQPPCNIALSVRPDATKGMHLLID
jgi:hypothetical protein